MSDVLSPSPEALAMMRQVQEKKYLVTLEPWQEEIIAKMEFVLSGYNVDGTETKRSDGIAQIQNIEKTLVIDPVAIQRDLKKIAKADPENRENLSTSLESFSQEGRHSHVNTARTLFRNRYLGWQILAGLRDDEGNFFPVATNYGLDTMPTGTVDGDHEFDSLDYGTLFLGRQGLCLDSVEPSKTAINWRTSVLASIPAEKLRHTITSLPKDMTDILMRRLGVASALKYIMTLLVDRMERESISYNIGTIYQLSSKDGKTDKSIRLRNAASYEHTRHLFAGEAIGEGYRDFVSPVLIPGKKDTSTGHRNFVAKILWFARQSRTKDVLHNLHSPKSPLKSRQWPMAKLEETAEIMSHQIKQETERGDHVNSKLV